MRLHESACQPRNQTTHNAPPVDVTPRLKLVLSAADDVQPSATPVDWPPGVPEHLSLVKMATVYFDAEAAEVGPAGGFWSSTRRPLCVRRARVR